MFKQNLKIIFVIIGALIGAGFASGQEIYLFFFSYGYKGLLGVAISSLLFSLIVYKVFIIISQNDVKSYKDFLNVIIKTNSSAKNRLVLLTNIIINTFILVTFFIMIAGFGTYLSENFNIPQLVGSSILATLCVVILSKEIKGLIKVSELIVPVLIIFITIIGAFCFKNIDFANFNIEAEKNNWLISSILYTSYNMILLIPIMISLNKLIVKKHASKIAIIIGAITILLASSVYIAMTKIDVDIDSLEMPMLYVISNQFPYFSFIYGVIILLSILTTAVSLGTGLLQNIEKNRKTKMAILVLICIISVPISAIGFSNLIQFMYPVFGYLGLIQLIKIITVKT